MADGASTDTPLDAIAAKLERDSRAGCCGQERKSCTYHQGYEDALDVFTGALGAAGWRCVRGDEQDAAEAVCADAAALLALKDGPRDLAYRARKEPSWTRLRESVAVWRRRGTPGRPDHDNEGAGTR